MTREDTKRMIEEMRARNQDMYADEKAADDARWLKMQTARLTLPLAYDEERDM